MKILTTLLLFFATLFCYGQVATVEINENAMGQGGEILLMDETGADLIRMQPLFSGAGGFLGVHDSEGLTGFFVNGNFSDGRALVRIQGVSTTSFIAGETGDAAVVLPTDAVSSTEILNEAGASYDVQSSTGNVTNSVTTITSTTITVPAAGHVLVMGNSQLSITHTTGGFNYVDYAVADQNTSIDGVQDVIHGLGPSAPSGEYYIPGNAHGIFNVTAGSHTFYLLTKKTGTGTVQVLDSKLSAIYIPTAYGTIEGESAGSMAPRMAPGPLTDDEDNLSSVSSVSSGKTQAEISSDAKISIAANQARMQKEIDELKAMLLQMKSAENNGQE